MKKKINFSLFIILLCTIIRSVFGQSGLCTVETPFYEVDLVGNPGGTWISEPPIVRDGDCCGSSFPDRCIEFEILLDSATVAINFEIASGAEPGGSMFYKISCGPETKVGEPICVDGPGPHTLTFCKPGKNLNTYAITAIPAPGTSPDSKTSEGCNTKIGTVGLLNDITWRDLTGDGEYNSYLDCTVGCDTVTVTPTNGYPEYVEYEVCGTPASGPCSPIDFYCDTIRVDFIPPLVDSIYPNPAEFCENSSGVMLMSSINGGLAPYSYIWTDPNGSLVDSTPSILANIEGEYTVEIYDALYPNCPAKTVSGNVSMVLPPEINTIETIYVCSTNPIASLTATAQRTLDIEWFGSGEFTNKNNLSTSYYPTQDEINSGAAIIYIQGTGLGNCENALDSVQIIINPPIETSIIGETLICFGTTQDLKVEVAGGTPNYTILWDNGINDSINPRLGPGSYSVVVVDESSNTCTDTTLITIIERPEIYTDLDSVTEIFCDNTTSLFVSAYGGTGSNYSYNWNNGESGSAIQVSPGEYAVSVTDEAGCKKNDTTYVISTNSDLNFSFPSTKNVCFQDSILISPNITGGFPPFNYSWEDGTLDSSKYLTAGNYCLDISDSLGCSVSKCITIHEDSLLEVTIFGPNIICKDSLDELTSYVIGGTPPYSYQWQDGSTSPNISGPAGVYTLTVVDANTNSCTALSNFELKESSLLNTTIQTTPITCPNTSDGSLSVSAFGSEGNYSFLWDNGVDSATNLGLDTGWHFVEVLDQIGCTAIDSGYLTYPDSIQLELSEIQNISCYGYSDGKAKVIANGGTGDYTYLWTSGETLDSAINLEHGIQSIKVTDANSCETTLEFILSEPKELIATPSDIFDLLCFESFDGTFTVNASGGTRPYQYNWNPNVTSDSIGQNLSADDYSVEIIDAKGCAYTLNQSIQQPSPFDNIISINNQVLCFGESTGSATTSLTGGTPPYSYLWSNSETTATNNLLNAGKHYLTYRDDNNCEGIDSIIITEPDQLLLMSSPDGLINCDSITEVYTNVSGGTLPYDILWSTGDIKDTIIVNNSGKYLVSVTDVNGCKAIDTVVLYPLNSTLDVTINGPSHICFNSSTTLTSSVIPGFPPFNYEWDDGSTNSTLFTTGGLHTLTVTDSAGCIFTASKEVIMDENLISSINQDSVCFGQSKITKVKTSGGLPPFTYTWSNGLSGSPVSLFAGMYEVYTIDSTGCKDTNTVSIIENGPYDLSLLKKKDVSCFNAKNGWINTQTIGGFPPFVFAWEDSRIQTSNRSNLSPGEYTITVTDLIGCSDTLITEINGPDSVLKLLTTINNPSCYNEADGSIIINPEGGYPPYSYLWWENNSTEDQINQLSPGNYNVSVMDSGECIINSTFSIVEPDLLTGFVNLTNVDCYDNNTGAAVSAIIGGTAPYTINWSNGLNDTNKIDNLPAGDYKMFISDINNCRDTALFKINQPDSLNVNFDLTNVKCFGESNGNIIANVSGGSPVYNYRWDNSAVVGNELSNLTAKTYGLTVIDTKGCEKYVSTELQEPDKLEVALNIEHPLCYNLCNGSINITSTGGVKPYRFNIGNGDESDSIFNNLCPKLYNVFVTDSNDCQAFEINVPIIAPDTFKIIDALKTDLLCKEICDGTINIRANEFALFSILPGYSFSSDSVYTNLCDGTYDVYAKNNNDCMDSVKSLTLNAPPLITFSPQHDTTICINGEATFQLKGGGGSGALKYYVNGTDTNTTGEFTFNVMSDTTLTFEIVDENNCSPLTPITAKLFVYDSLSLNAYRDSIICAQDSVLLHALYEGGNGNYTINWYTESKNISTQDSVLVFPLTTTQYEIALSDGCESPIVYDTIQIEVLEYPDFKIQNNSENLCAPSDVRFWIESNQINNYEIAWKLNDVMVSDKTSDTLLIDEPGIYDLELNLTSPQNCNFVFYNSSFFETKPYPQANAKVDNTVKKISDPIFTFTNNSIDYDSISWIINQSRTLTEEKIMVRSDSIGCFPVSILAYSNAGCADTLTQNVCVEDIYQIFAPNSFTPNDDGINEGFIPTIRNVDISTFDFWIYDRWGEMIYHTKNPYEPWNGRRNNNLREAQIDVYVWVLRATDNWGIRQYHVGRVSLIR